MNRNKVIVTSRRVIKGRLIAVGAFSLALAAGILVYELGLSRAGFNRLESMDAVSVAKGENRELRSEVKSLREQLAVLETAAKIDREGYRKVEEELVGLQARILEQQEDIEFYKGIVNENDGTGLRIQDFQVSQGLGPQEFDMRLVLAQAFRKDRQVSGSVEIVVEGMQRGKPARLALDKLVAVSQEGSGPLKYSFRYFQDLKMGLVLPADFVPERVHVIVRPKGKTSKTVEDFFVWEVKPS